MLLVNFANLSKKEHSLKNIIRQQNIGVFSGQESHYSKKGKLQVDDFYIFEAIRKCKEKGGSIMGFHKALKPILLKEYSDEFELLVVEVNLNGRIVRFITGYGPQESWKEIDRVPFFNALEREISSAEIDDRSVFIQMDANSKLGPKVIPGDPHPQSENNGKMLQDIIDRHALIVVNGMEEIRSGVITRERITTRSVERSVIDLVIVSHDLREHIKSIYIDEGKFVALNKIVKKHNDIKIVKSDHNSIITKLKCLWSPKQRKDKIEIYNFKNAECQKYFHKATDETKDLSNIFKSKKNVNILAKKFLNRLGGFICQNFNKIRIKDNHKNNIEIDKLFDKRRELRGKADDASKEELKEVEFLLAEKIGDDMYKQVKNEIKGLNSEEGGVNTGHLWRLRKKLFPRASDPPAAMKDQDGVLITDPDRIKSETLIHYQKVLANRPIKDGYDSFQKDREDLCKNRLEMCKKNKTPEWTLNQLEVVLKHLKKDVSRDPHGMANELFKSGVAGKDLKLAVLMLMNRIKDECVFPDCLKLCNITSLYKRKGAVSDFDSYRGIFRVTILRCILDRLMYNDEYPIIDKNLTDCNVGGRKGRNIRDNLFVVYAVTNSLKRKNEEPIDINVYDVMKCFDALWNEECINDLYEAGLTNDKLPLLFLENKSAQVAIKTPHGMTQRVDITNVIMQGTVWGGLFCTTSMDKLGKQAYREPDLLYKYKNVVEVPPLEMIDDVLTIQKCGTATVIQNSAVNAFIESKKLKLSGKKCAQIHIGSRNKCGKCAKLFVHGNIMRSSTQEKYLGDLINHTGKPHATVMERKAKGYGIVAEIMTLLHEIPLGKRRVQLGLDLRQAWFLNGCLYNSESWHSLTVKDVEELSTVDCYLLRSVLGSHSKVPIEQLFLETGALPVKYVLSIRRMIYLQTILKRDDSDLLKRVYRAQKDDPIQGDWVEYLEKDFEAIGEVIDEDIIANKTNTEHKRYIKNRVREVAFKDLKIKQSTHSKVKNIQYLKFKVQEYLTCGKLNNEESSLLFNMRCKSVTGVKSHFHTMYNDTKCPLCGTEEDSLDHILTCSLLSDRMVDVVKVDDMFGVVEKQTQLTKIMLKLLKKRKTILEIRDNSDEPTGA